MEKEIVPVPGLSESLAGLPLSLAVKGAGLVFISATPPIDKATGKMLLDADFSTQSRHCLENIKAALEAAGSSLEKVLKVTVYVSNAAYFNTFNEIYREYFPTAPPARTFVAVGSWPVTFDIEVECIALAD
jgi:2-iminobutanoate/2-iminopropanoate deaminase